MKFEIETEYSAIMEREIFKVYVDNAYVTFKDTPEEAESFCDKLAQNASVNKERREYKPALNALNNVDALCMSARLAVAGEVSNEN